jgi:hypothetical protein
VVYQVGLQQPSQKSDGSQGPIQEEVVSFFGDKLQTNIVKELVGLA